MSEKIRSWSGKSNINLIKAEDLNKGAEFQDAVCKVSFGVVGHSLDREDGGGFGS